MSIIRKGCDLFGERLRKGNIPSKCMICDERDATAYWMCRGEGILVCRWCAQDTLGKLVADAVVGWCLSAGRQPTAKELQEAKAAMLSAFWYGTAMAMLTPPPATS